jgi:hypothetical protein
MKTKLQTVGLLLSGMVLGGLLVSYSHLLTPHVQAAQGQMQAPPPAQDTAATLAAMQADIAHLKDVVPSQSHTMADVAYHFSNVWFAGKKSNWALAAFNLRETRQHIRWTIRVRPVRKLGDSPVELQPMWDAIDNGVMNNLQKAIDDKDVDKFETAYKRTLTACYGCHQAAGLPYLHPVIPSAPPQTIISFDPVTSE